MFVNINKIFNLMYVILLKNGFCFLLKNNYIAHIMFINSRKKKTTVTPINYSYETYNVF